MEYNSGISEVLGSLLLIAVFVTAFGIIAVTYLSQPLPEKYPEVSFEIKLGTDNTIHLIHAGGDSLKTYNSEGRDASSSAEYYILVDGEMTWPITDAYYPVMKGEQRFAYRGNLQSDSNIEYLQPGEGFSVQPLSLPKTIDIIYRGPDGAEKILWSGLIPRIIDFQTGGGSISSGSGSIGMSGAIRICVDDTITFHDTSLGNIVYSDWDFNANINPGIDSYELHPSWTYTDTGLYTVIHSVGTDEGLNFTLTKQNYIEVKPVHADFSATWDADGCESTDNSCTYCKDKYPGRPCGREPFSVEFVDESFCNPEDWYWTFGDGQSSSLHEPTHEYLYGTGDYITPKLYSVNLTASNSGGSDSMPRPDYVVVLPNCFEPTADFSYDGEVDLDGNMAVTFTDLSTAYPDEIVSWEWNFGDTKPYSYDQNPPVHEYDAGDYNVTLTVTNDCGRDATRSRLISFPCDTLTAQMSADPPTGPSPLDVTFTDLSTPHENITSWRWSFGDGTYYYTENKANPNPPPHTYTRVGTFHASLVVQNNCGQGFVKTQVIVASKDASITGTVWDDRNEDGGHDPGETGIVGWPIYLDERRNGRWEQVDTTTTNATGSYLFELAGVSNSVFRVRQDLGNRPGETWRTTYSHGTIKEEISDNILIYNTRHYSGIDFGNIKRHRSQISVPGSFYLYGRPGYANSTFYYSSLSRSAQFLDYNTSYNTYPRVVFMQPPSSSSGTMTPDPAGGYPNGYENWGDSSFTLTFREYNNYLKYVGQGAYYLDWWQYPIGTNYHKGNDILVPDETILPGNQLKLTYKWDSSIHFDIDKPKNGDIIPYVSSYIVEAHFQGLGEQTSECYLMTPVSGKLFYNSTVGEYLITNIDTRPFEGKIKLFTARMKLKSGAYSYAYSTASIAYEKTAASITGITSEATWPTFVKGNATVTATVSGKWQVSDSAVLYIDEEPVTTMSVLVAGPPSTLQSTFNVEPYAGRTVPVFIRVPYDPIHTDEIGSVTEIMGPHEDSPAVSITALSKEPIHADYSAYPLSGRTPHEVAFTDTSTGGANIWDWDFGDGQTSDLQHPIHVFHGEGIYPVSLTVTNATPMSDSITKNITVQGAWRNTTLLTNRYCSLAAGGMVDFITRGTDSEITINGTRYTLPDGDTVALSLNTKAENAKFFIAGSISECDLPDANLTVNGEFIDKGSVSDIRIQDFENFHSNLTLSAERSYSQWVTFEWEGFAIPLSWKRSLVIEDLMPSLERFMNLELSPSQTHYDGMAGTYHLI